MALCQKTQQYKKISDLCSLLCLGLGGITQNNGWLVTPEMHVSRRRHLNLTKSSLWHIWGSDRGQCNWLERWCSKGISYPTCGRMPKIWYGRVTKSDPWQQSSYSTKWMPLSEFSYTACLVGNVFIKVVPKSTRWERILSCGHRLLHKVGGGQSTYQYHI